MNGRALTYKKFEHQLAFWAGIITTIAGISLQLPMFFSARMNHYHLYGMAIPPSMYAGMALIVVGVAVTIYGVWPVSPGIIKDSSRIRVRAMDGAPIRSSHVALLAILTFAIVIDTMKPTTLAFIAPGAELEYHLRGPLNPHANALPIALYPLSGITGTVIGSFAWGWLSDKLGRRSAILIATVIFISSSTCGAMPKYWMNLLCCLYMGLGAGGMIPIAYTLISETIPARHRGWIMVLLGGGGASLAYFCTSFLASTIGSPQHFGWRIMWLVGIPIGLVLVLLNHWIPESPRYLIQHGRDDEARAVMLRYGAALIDEKDEISTDHSVKNSYWQVISGSLLTAGLVVLILGISIGLTQYGLQQWMPSDLQKAGFTSANATDILRDASLYGLPFSVPVALLYGFWSSRKTIIGLVIINMLAMAGFIVGGARLIHDHGLLQVFLVLPTTGIALLTGLLVVYAVEVYPTKVRSRGSGLAAGATKFGGVLILALAATAFTTPSIATVTVIALVPMGLAVIAIAAFGPETYRRTLEEISTSRPETLVS